MIFTIISCQNNPTKESKEVAEKYLEFMYTCNLNEALKFCTKEAKEDLSWYASNLTDQELSLITKRPVISILKSNLQGDTLISVNYRAEQVLVTDSLEHVGHIGTKEGTLELVRISKKWKVKSER